MNKFSKYSGMITVFTVHRVRNQIMYIINCYKLIVMVINYCEICTDKNTHSEFKCRATLREREVS